MLKNNLLSIVVLLALTSLALADARSDVDRLFMQASSGEIKYQEMVQPSKDSLIAMGDSAAKYLVYKLSSTDARERHTLADIYRGIGKPATPYLLAALDTDNEDQLRSAVRCLGEVKDSAAVDRLLETAAHEEYTVRSEAVTAIGKIGGGYDLAGRVALFLTDSVYVVRKSCVAALNRIKSATSIPVLAGALSDDRFEVRLTAYQALLNFDSLAYPQVLDLLQDAPSKRVEAMAVRMAGVLKMADGAASVRNRLTSDNAIVRGWACWSYARLGGTASELERTLVDEQDDFVKSQLAASLEYLRNNTADE